MEYVPRYSQPFTLQEARGLDVPIITEEISRLQNSIAHLQRTQDELKDALSITPGDLELLEAFEENEVVIGSQNERISMLRIALAEKGVPMSAHYDLRVQLGTTAMETSNAAAPPGAIRSGNPRTEGPSTASIDGENIDGENEGIYL
ncbi:hypothetical protein BD309DRAFT_861017 [Dichomitus squalens]|uniref:Uncharacterized protein n=1 Tax=Dichomitus squalens TaxID=114155 RepID=A0A4Q9NY29_9APHY|nr:hypothetical protein BD309DRAFT_861017 [Dichomitus squalens]TBU63939.1 hypothetical protein BD310DRAFT_458980 [Dichomitus squalens]